MKGKEIKKEKKKEKLEGPSTKAQSDYQSDKTRKSIPETVASKSKK